MKRVRNVLLVQARMGSSRFPGKMSKEFGDEVLLGYVLENLLSWNSVDEIILATSISEADCELASIAHSKGVGVYRGSEHNVAERLIQAGMGSEMGIEDSKFFRVCADNPFLCEDLYLELLNFLEANNELDYLSHQIETKPAILTDYGVFIEYFNLSALSANSNDLSFEEKEHATLSFLNSHANTRKQFLPHKWRLDLRTRLTCDTRSDYEILRRMAGKMDFPITSSQVEELVGGLDEEVLESMEQQRINNRK